MAKRESDVPAIAGLSFDELQECLLLGATLEQVRELAEGGFGYSQIRQLSNTLGQAKSQGARLSAADLKGILQEQRKALKPENATHPGISAFSYPEGDVARPKPALRRETFFNGIREDVEALTPAEVEMYNRFEGTRTARNGMWTAEVRRNGSSEQLFITNEPKTLDGRQALPAISLILRELLDGEEAVNPDTLAQRVAELEAKIRSLAPTSA